jgi:hypothetical protein
MNPYIALPFYRDFPAPSQRGHSQFHSAKAFQCWCAWCILAGTDPLIHKLISILCPLPHSYNGTLRGTFNRLVEATHGRWSQSLRSSFTYTWASIPCQISSPSPSSSSRLREG